MTHPQDAVNCCPKQMPVVTIGAFVSVITYDPETEQDQLDLELLGRHFEHGLGRDSAR